MSQPHGNTSVGAAEKKGTHLICAKHPEGRSAANEVRPLFFPAVARRQQRRRGAMMVLVVILLPILFLLAAMAINVSYVQLVRTELQISTDAAGRAAGRTFALTGDPEQALVAAQRVAARNTVAGAPLPITASDLDFGLAERPGLDQRYGFAPSANANAVQLTTRTFAARGGVAPFLPGIAPLTSLRPVRSSISTQVEVDIALVIDRSGSMAYASHEIAQYPPAPVFAPPGWDFGAPVPPGARWLDTVAAVRVFLQELDQSPQTERVALSTYNHTTSIDVPATTRYGDVITALNTYSFAFDSGGTAIGDGIRQGIDALGAPTTRPWASKVIIVMTDGIQNFGSDPVSAAASAAGQGVMVYSVTFSSEADQERMRRVAEKGGGVHYHAVDAAQLRAAFEDIARRLPTLLTR